MAQFVFLPLEVLREFLRKVVRKLGSLMQREHVSVSTLYAFRIEELLTIGGMPLRLITPHL